ncbi:MAG: hypothetical protein ACTSSG_07450 [Candidatus Heimdallarchaeaceae archaeon]
MLPKLSKEEFDFFLFELKDRISYILSFLDDKKSMQLLSFLLYSPSDFKTIKVEFAHIAKEILAGYVTRFWDFGLIDINKKGQYEITNSGKKFLEGIVQMAIESTIVGEMTNPKMKEMLIKKIGEKDIKKFKKEREEKRAMGVQLGIALSFRI